MFYDEIPWFYRDFESENLFLKPVLSWSCENTGPVTGDHVKSPLKWETEHLCNPKGYSFISKQVSYFYFLEANFINVF